MANRKSPAKKQQRRGGDDAELNQSGRSTSRAKTRKEASTHDGASTSNGNPMTAADVMDRDPLTMLEIATIAEAAERMRDADTDTIVVLNDTTANPMGIVTAKDIVLRAISEGRDPAKTTLSTVQSDGLVIVDADAPVQETIALMRERGIRRIPVVEGRDVLGVVTLEHAATAVEPKQALGALATQS